MGMPVSGFPNQTAATQTDDMGELYLTNVDFLKNGVPASIIATVVVATLGFVLMKAIGHKDSMGAKSRDVGLLHHCRAVRHRPVLLTTRKEDEAEEEEGQPCARYAVVCLCVPARLSPEKEDMKALGGER
ncbi:low-affinity phosphate transporter [Serendipita sp. 399]|nr:low-affinity phosphate transporter [Serendipita sp. 399]